MRIAVLGTGMVGRALAGRLDELGNEVIVGTRDAEATMARADSDSYAAWAADHPDVDLAGFADAAAKADLIVNATSGGVSIAALQSAGEQHLAGKVLLDASNPLDFSQGMPPTLLVKDTDSLGEQIQREFPDLKVVKSLNTMTAALMANPRRLADGDHSVFVSGNDADAKRMVRELLEAMGHTDVIDLGDITSARGAEMMLPLWLRLYGAMGNFDFNFKIVR